MKVYAKFRIDIDKEDESIYTQKAVNLMQKLGCKAEKLYSSMERYTFTVDIKEAVYRELVELQKKIDQVFQYDEDTEEDDDELLDIIEPDIWCSYIPKYTQEEEKNAIGYYIDLAGYEFEENEKKVYESLCPECETFFQNKEYTFKKKKQLEDLGFGGLPVCMAKTQYSFSDDATLLGAPKGFTITVRNLKVSAGAGFLVALTGDIMTMPGLPKVPAAEKIDVDEHGRITGLF